MKKLNLIWNIVSFFLLIPLSINAILVDVIQNDYRGEFGNETLADGFIDAAIANQNTVGDNDFTAVSNTTTGPRNQIGFNQFALNSSEFPENATHTTTVLEAYQVCAASAEGANPFGKVSVHIVSPVDGVNGTMPEGGMSYNVENPCPQITLSNMGLSPFCNGVAENWTTLDASNAGKNVSFNITNAVNTAINALRQNITTALVESDTGDMIWRASDTVNVNKQPCGINITYKITEATNPCACPSSGNWEINGNLCNLTTVCNLNGNNFRLNSGALRIQGGGKLITKGFYVSDTSKFYVDDNAGLTSGQN